ncbi:MAG: hypothetical protein CMB80_01815 [Flammeovirgaceae bacterium]|nr:hypothetical protein [Flammeovirgaceae bacterium]
MTVKTRIGFKLVKEFPKGEEIISMLKHGDSILITTNKSVYKHIYGTMEFEPMDFWIKDD